MSNAAQATKRYEQRMKDKGFVRKHVWVPADKADEVEAVASKFRIAEEWDKAAIEQERDRIISTLHANKRLLNGLGILHIYLFGSFARGDAEPESDIDLMVDIAPSERPQGFFGHAKFAASLESLLELGSDIERRIDLHERQKLKPEVRERVAKESIEVF